MKKLDAILFTSLTAIFATTTLMFFLEGVSWEYYVGASVAYWMALAVVSSIFLEVWHKYEQLKIEHKKEQRLKETYLAALTARMNR